MMKMMKKLLLLLAMLTCGMGAAWAQQQQFHVTIAETQHGSVNVDNTAPYNGETVRIKVAPESGYMLGELLVTCGEEGDVTTLNLTDEGNGVYSFIMPDLDVTVTATFKQILYLVEVEEPLLDQQGFGVGFVMVNNTGHSDNKFAEGEIVSLLVSADTGYALTRLEVTYEKDGVEVNVPCNPSGNDSYTFVMPAADVHVHWIIDKAQYTITIGESKHGTVEAPATAQYREEVTLKVTPNEHYSQESVSVAYTNGYPVTVADNKFTMPAANVVVKVTYKPEIYNITVNATEHGTVTAPATAGYDTPVEITVNPEKGYQIASIKVLYKQGAEEKTINPTLTETGAYTFAMPAAQVSVVATFEPVAYKISIAPTEHGKVTAPATAGLDAPVEITVAPDGGYQLASIKVLYNQGTEEETIDPTLTGNGTYTFAMPAANVSVVATFEPIAYKIFVASTEHGTVTAPATALFGTLVDVTITPEPGYEIDEIYYTYDVGGSVADPKFGIDNGSFTMPGTDVTIVSSFKPCVFNITTHVNPGDEAGSIQVASSAAFGSEVEVTATPAQGYVLKEIYYTYDAGGGVADPKFGIHNGKFTMIAVDITVVAVFEPVTEYNVIVSADMVNGSVQADKNNAAPGETVTLTVTPTGDYKLETIKVTYDDGTPAEPETGNAPRRVAREVPVNKVDDTHYTFVMPAGNVTIQATFVIEVPTGVADINAASGEPMRYFDLQGRYIGTSLDGARRGIYVTADGRKVIK